MKPLRIALTKGRLEKDTVALLESAGYDCTAVRENDIFLNKGIVANNAAAIATCPDGIEYV